MTFFGGGDDGKGQLGVGVAVSTDIVEATGCEPVYCVSPRLMTLRLHTSLADGTKTWTNFIVGHAPTETADDELKDAWYNSVRAAKR